MKNRIALLLTVLSLVLVSGFLAYNQEIFARYLTNKPAVAFEDYSKMTKKRDRNAAFAKETAASKSILWRQHIAHVVATVELNERQKDFLNKLSLFLDESFFVTVEAQKGLSEYEFAGTAQGKPYEELMRQVSELFTKEQMKLIFSAVGDGSTITDFGCGKTSTEGDTSNSFEPIEPEGGGGTCNCTGSFCGSGCPTGTTCYIIVDNPCDQGGSCGCGGWFDCTARCFRNN